MLPSYNFGLWVSDYECEEESNYTSYKLLYNVTNAINGGQLDLDGVKSIYIPKNIKFEIKE